MPSLAAFDLVNLQDSLKANTVEFPMDAKIWNSFASTFSYNWVRVKFERGNTGIVPDDKKGLYFFVVEPAVASLAIGFPMYAGKVEKDDRSFRVRYSEYLSDAERRKPKRPKIVRLIVKFSGCLYFYYAAMPDGTNIAVEEDELIKALLPPANDNVPAEVRQVVKAF